MPRSRLRARKAILAATCAGMILGGSVSSRAQDAVADPSSWPTARSPSALTHPVTESRVRDLLARMTMGEKVGQLIQADIGSITPDDLGRYPVGSILAGGSSSPGGDERAAPQAWLDLALAFRRAAAERPGARIPLLFGVDAVHGHNNIVGATLFPHNIGLGATRDPALIRDIAEATAREVAATGVDWTFGPTLAVPRDDRWGRTYEGFAEHPEVQRALAGPFVEGLQGPNALGSGLAPGRVMGSAKHFLADGGTTDGRDRGDAAISEQALIDVHLSGYREAIDAGVLSVMVSFSGWNGVKLTGNRSLLTDVLRDRLGFQGLLIGDWDAHAFLPGCRSDSCPSAINAGLDMFMAPTAWKSLFENTLAQARSGEIPAARLDEAVSRILRVKLAAGAFDGPDATEGDFSQIGAPDHRALARQAVRHSLVLLKNENGVLPLRAGAKVLVAGAAADDIGIAAGGWTIGWQGTGNTNADFPGATSIWSGIRQAIDEGGGRAVLSPDGAFTDRPDVAIVVFGETPYAEFYGDMETLDYASTEALAILGRLKAAGVPTVSVFLSGRPLWTNPEINGSDAFVAAWLPGSEGAGVADVLVGDREGRPKHDFTGKLGFSWPRVGEGAPLNVGDPDYDPLFAYGFGLSYAQPGRTPPLSEISGVPDDGMSPPRMFAQGRFVAPWALTLRDSLGNFRVEQPGPAASLGGALTVTPVDGLAQESARRFTSTRGETSVVVGGPPTALDHTLSLSVRYRVTTPSRGGAVLHLGAREVPVDTLFGAASGWTTAIIPLSCFGDAASTPVSSLRFAFTGPVDLVLEDLRLVATPSGTDCDLEPAGPA